MSSSSRTLRNLLAKKELLVAPGAYDPYTARIIQSLGFPAVYLGGNAIGTALTTGEPLTTMTETVEAAQQVLRAIDVPLVVDANAGFGDAIHTYRTVQEFERIGVAAIHIEDQPFPKRAHYHKGMGHVTELEEVLDRLRAAIEARRDPDFVIIGRTDILRVTGKVGDAVERGRAYLEVGVDMLMIMGPPTVDQAREIRAELPDVPLMWLSGTAGRELSNQEVAGLGFDMVIFPVTTPVVITDAVIGVYSHLKQHGTLGLSEEAIAASREKILEVLGMQTYWEMEKRTTERA